MSKKKRNGLMNHNVWGDDYSEYYGEGGGGIYQGTPYTVKKGWNTGDTHNVCTNCDWHPKERKQKILIEYSVWKTLMGICTTVQVEWQALLTGTIETDGTVNITGYFIPKQEVTGSTVKNLDIIDDVVIAEKRIVAGVHSHGTMACFFSQTDQEHTNMSLIKHNIVINNRHEYKATSRIELPCGMTKFIEGEVFTVGEPVTDIIGLDNIVKKEYMQTPYVQPKQRDSNYKMDGMRWCPCCGMSPEEDGGATCVCWTKAKRSMLPDFTEENYVKTYGRTYELKPHLEHKFKDMID